MGITIGIFDVFKTKSAVSWGDLSRHFDDVGSGESGAVYNKTKDYLDAYQAASYAGNLVKIIASDAASLDIDFYVNKKEDETLDQLLEQSISGISYREFIEYAIITYLLDGNVFVMKSQTNMAQISLGKFDYTILNPSTVDIYSDTGAIITAGYHISGPRIGYYRVRINSRDHYDIQPENMIHIKMIGPANTIRGMGKIQQNTSLFDSDRMAIEFNNKFFAQGAKIPYAFSPDQELVGQQYVRVVNQFRASMEGAKNWMKTLILPVKGTFNALSVNHSDMQFNEQRQFTKADVREIFQVPIILLGGADARFDSAEEQIKGYYGFTLPRYLTPIEELLSRIYSEIAKKPLLKVKFDYPKIYSAKDAPAAFDRGAITPNEMRKILGFEPIENKPELDNYYVSMSYMPIEDSSAPPTQTILPTKPPTEASQTQADSIENGVEKSVVALKSEHPHGFFLGENKGPSSKLRIHRRAIRSKKRAAATIEKNIIAYYKSLESRVLAEIKSPEFYRKISENNPFNMDEEIVRAKAAAKSTFSSAVAIGVNDVNELFGTSVDSSTRNPRVRLVVEKLVKNYADRTLNSRRDELRTIIQNWRSEGQPISELSGRIKEHFETLTGSEAWRATRIARTEASLAWDQSAVMSYDELGVTAYDIVGCEDDIGDCNATGIQRDEVDGLDLHPNHTGTLVPS